MFSRPICPFQSISTDLDDCIYQCFEAYRRRVHERRVARRAKRQQRNRQSLKSEQYQNFPSQESLLYSQYSNAIDDTQHYQTLLEPIDVTIPEETPQKNAWEYNNIEQSITLPNDSYYETYIRNARSPYHQLREVQYTSEEATPSYMSATEQAKQSTEFKNSEDIYIQTTETTAYSNQSSEYQTLSPQQNNFHLTNQQLVGSSVPTGTVEYTKETHFSQAPISDQSDTISYVTETYSAHNQQYTDYYLPSAAAQTYDQNINTYEQIIPQQVLLPSDEESQQRLIQQTTSDEQLPSQSTASKTDQQQQHLTAYPPSETDSNEDAQEDQEILGLRACICRCYAKFRDLRVKEQQERFQQQYSGIPQAPVQTNIQEKQYHKLEQTVPQTYTQQIEQPIITSIPTRIQPLGSSSIPPCNQQLIQQSNTILSINCDHKEPLEQNIQMTEIHYVDATTQTPPCPTSIEPRTLQRLCEQIPPTFETSSAVPETTTVEIPVEQQEIEYVPSIRVETSEIVPSLSPRESLPSYREIKRQKPTTYKQVICPPTQIQYPAYLPTVPREEHYVPMAPPLVQEHVRHPPPTLLPIEKYQVSFIPPVDTLRPHETVASVPHIDTKTGLCLVPCPETVRHAHLPPQFRPELFCTELPPISSLPPPPLLPPSSAMPPPSSAVGTQNWCVRCCCVPGKSLIKKNVYKQVQEGGQHAEESYLDYGAVIDQMQTRITVRYGNSIMEEGETFICGNYNEQLRVIDFPVYISGQSDVDMTPLIPNN